MSSIADAPVAIRISSQLVPATPPRFGEATLIVHYLTHLGVLSSIEEHIRFARRRFGHYELIDFLAVPFGYAISGDHQSAAGQRRLLARLFTSIDLRGALTCTRRTFTSIGFSSDALRRLAVSLSSAGVGETTPFPARRYPTDRTISKRRY